MAGLPTSSSSSIAVDTSGSRKPGTGARYLRTPLVSGWLSGRVPAGRLPAGRSRGPHRQHDRRPQSAPAMRNARTENDVITGSLQRYSNLPRSMTDLKNLFKLAAVDE